MMKRTIYFLFTAVLLCALAPSRANAQTQAGQFRVSLDTELLGFGKGEIDPDGRNNDIDYDAVTFGLGMAGTGIGFGYTVIDNLLIGGRLSLGLEGLDRYQIDGDGFIWSVMFYAEYIFLPGMFRPFVTATLGFGGIKTDDLIDCWWWSMTGGIGGGLHIFLIPNVSLDATLLIKMGGGTGEFENNVINDIDYKHWLFSFDLALGVSAWF